jgi:hypothetical protein
MAKTNETLIICKLAFVETSKYMGLELVFLPNFPANFEKIRKIRKKEKNPEKINKNRKKPRKMPKKAIEMKKKPVFSDYFGFFRIFSHSSRFRLDVDQQNWQLRMRRTLFLLDYNSIHSHICEYNVYRSIFEST